MEETRVPNLIGQFLDRHQRVTSLIMTQFVKLHSLQKVSIVLKNLLKTHLDSLSPLIIYSLELPLCFSLSLSLCPYMEDGDSNQEHPQPLTTNHDATSPKKPSTSSVVVDKLKRDEWSEEQCRVYSKPTRRNGYSGTEPSSRAKTGKTWLNTCLHALATPSLPRLRRSARTRSSPWRNGTVLSLPLPTDHLLRGNASTSVHLQPQPVLPLNCSAPLLLLEPPSLAVTHPPQQPPAAQMSHGSNGVGTVKVTNQSFHFFFVNFRVFQ